VLTRLGWTRAEVHGWLLAPPVRRDTPADVRATANACATLIELHHFASSETTYHPAGIELDGRSETPSPPFASTVIIPLAAEGDASQNGGAGLGVGGLMREWLPPYGKIAECSRSSKPTSERIAVRTIGAVHFVWPRDAILTRAAIRTSLALVSHWL